MGVEAPATCQGKDLSNAIVQGDDDAQESVPLFCLPMDWRGIYTPRYTFAMDVSQGEQTHYREWLFKKRESRFHIPLTYNLLFDRENDTSEMNNLYSSSQHMEIREMLYKYTMQWMDKFGDTGLPYIRIAEKTKTPEDMKAWLSAKFGEVEGELNGRPIDLLKNQSDTNNR
jgi:hypothetical protein